MPAYLDAASGAPLHPLARRALDASLDDGWADPTRLHGAGRRARLLLDAARESMADTLRVRPDELSFVANGTQSLQAAVLGTVRGNDRHGSTVVHSAVEHSAVLHAAAAAGRPISIGVDAYGRVDADAFVAATQRPGVVAAALQAANHEVGTTQPVESVAADIAPVALIVDATQTIGHAAVPDGWSVLAGDARMWGGPALGVLVVRTGVRWRSPYPADEAEAGRIPGIPAVPSAVAAAAALRAVATERSTSAERHRALIDRLRAEVPARIADIDLVGDPVGRLPHIVTFSCLYADGESLLRGLDRRGFAVTSGSSCASSTIEPSHVLVAMGALTSGNLRVSLHRDTTEDQIEEFLDVLPEVVAEVRAELGAGGL